MTSEEFKVLHDNLEEHINEIKTTLKIKDLLDKPEQTKKFERMRYLYYSTVKALVDLGHSIIFENDLRDPVNRADIFISLAEKDIMMSSVVPGLKRATLTLPQINTMKSAQAFELIAETIDDIYKCLDSFVVYFGLQGEGTGK
ncbi:hypothetical protein AMJ87_13050 [candidate division WOR_3 bacterium SM23_60]|uniref:DUF86 domain-containing protein n=1 Tax=candidate division WOR_3 bacterium SM23_60 TaxID=1703780 RepID=A0A0S8G4A0_UNCW3|nr:MAG: hypothetical protein AMJ87_13050 [candidate division WOR_3 bacterium SM23_60]